MIVPLFKSTATGAVFVPSSVLFSSSFSLSSSPLLTVSLSCSSALSICSFGGVVVLIVFALFSSIFGDGSELSV